MRSLLKFFGLPLAEQRLLLRAVMWLALAGLLVRLLPFSRVKKMIAAAGPAPGSSARRRYPAERMAWAVAAAGRRVPGTTCLVQALVAERMLRQEGYPAELRIGVAAGQRAVLHAHAWIESEGRILLGGEENVEQFTALPALEKR